jgi:arsenate reductase
VLNTSGIEYRKQGLAAKLPQLDDAAFFTLVRTNGMFVKRPFVIGPGVAWWGSRRRPGRVFSPAK